MLFVRSGTHAHNSLESTLQAHGGPFLYGLHHMDDPDIRDFDIERGYLTRMLREDPEAAALLDTPTLHKYDWKPGDPWPKFQVTRRHDLPEIPPGGWPHLSWCYVNHWESEPPVPYAEIIRRILQADPGASLCLWVTSPHPQLVTAVELLRGHFRGRHVVLYHKRDNVELHDAGGQWREIADWLWDVADFRYMTGCGLISKGTRAFCRRHGIEEPMTLRTLHSAVSLQDLNRALRRGESLLSGQPWPSNSKPPVRTTT